MYINSIGILLIYYLSKIMINLILTMIGIIKDFSSLYFYYRIKEKYREDNTKFYIMVIIMIFLLYPYIIIMACINFLYNIPSLIKSKFKNGKI